MTIPKLLLQLIVTKVIILILLLIISLSSSTMNSARFKELHKSWRQIHELHQIHKLLKIFTVQSSLSIIVNNLVGLLLDQFDGWEALHLDVFKLIGG